MTKLKEEIHYKGLSISKGVAVGTLYHLEANERFSVPKYMISAHQVDLEIERYRRAIALSSHELERLQYHLDKEGLTEAMSIINAHIEMLNDPIITTDVEEKIKEMLVNTETVFVFVVDQYLKFFEKSDDPEIRQRLLDVKDLSMRILKHLHPQTDLPTSDIPSHSVVMSYELVPSQTAEASPNQVRAYITKIGGPTSHAALIAKSKGIPYVSNVDIESILSEECVNVIVDGDRGLVILNPSEETIAKYHGERFSCQKEFTELVKRLPEETFTRDGVKIEVQANLESLHDLHLLKEYKVKSIGLLRSEFLYLKKNPEEFSEEEQFQVYKKLMRLSAGMEVTFRVFDIGSDKSFFKTHFNEPNPALGCRSIRFLMEYSKIFSMQVRAILRAASFGNLQILLPLITDIEELREAKAFIQKERESLIREGYSIPAHIRLGCMVEVPAFVIMCDQFVKECDFLSIGTNDLFQYTLVADRCNPKTVNRYCSTHPSILRMIRHVVVEAAEVDIPVSICGEMAANPENTELLISLGIRKISCPPRFIPLVKQAVLESVSTGKTAK